MTLMTIRLELARDPEFPQGSSQHGYEFTAPLDENGHIDANLWKQHRDHCRVRRFWRGEEEEIGHLIHTKGRRWAFHYDLDGDPDVDEPGDRFDSHKFAPGEYVSITEQDGQMRTFAVVVIRPVSGIGAERQGRKTERQQAGQAQQNDK